MELIKINNLSVPAPTTYDVEYSDIMGEKSQTEDGSTYIEEIRNAVPHIKVGWTNLTQTEVSNITVQFENSSKANISYFYGSLKTCEMMVNNRKLKLKHIDDRGLTYWDLSFDLEG